MGTATNSLPVMALRKPPSLKRTGWLYPIFRDVYFYHGLLARFSSGGSATCPTTSRSRALLVLIEECC